MNAITTGLNGRIKMIMLENGQDPFDSKPARPDHQEVGPIPDPARLPPLTPAAFDAMFGGIKAVA